MTQQHLACVRGCNRPLSLDQHSGERLFQGLDTLRDGAARNAEHGCCAVKALLLDHSGKRFQLITIQHVRVLQEGQRRQNADCIHLVGRCENLSRWRGYRARLNGFQSYPSIEACWSELVARGIARTEMHGAECLLCRRSHQRSPQGAAPNVSPLADLRTVALPAQTPRPFAA